jgi:hypothetical protein
MEKKAHSINGVNGFLVQHIGGRAPGCFEKQKWVSETRKISGYGAGAEITVNVRFDDQCRNSHNSFAITADVVTPRSRRLGDIEAGGCLHDEIARVFPELKSLIEWHLFDTRGPMHYVANTVYHASNRADSRYEPGEACRWETRVKFSNFPITFTFAKRFREFLQARAESNARRLVSPVAVPYVKRDARDNYDFDPHYTVTGFECKEWHEAPFKSLTEAREFCEAINGHELSFVTIPTDYAKEKPRNLDAARSCANWPEATDEELCAPAEELTKALQARAPALLARFKAAIENECGMIWEAPEKV